MAPPKNLNQRIVIRLRPDQLDESRVLKDYEARSDLLGRGDHDYIRRLILIGHLFVSRMHPDISGNASGTIALSTNESNNTVKEQMVTSSNNESHVVSAVPAQNEEAKPEEVVGLAVRHMAGILGNVKGQPER